MSYLAYEFVPDIVRLCSNICKVSIGLSGSLKSLFGLLFVSRYFWFAGSLMVTGGLEVNAQQEEKNSVSGTVIDSQISEPLLGATVRVAGTGDGAFTNADGAFRLVLPSDTATLLISYVGYLTKSVFVNAGRSELVIEMSLDMELLSELVVVGYGQREKRDLTGTITSFQSDELNVINSTNVLQSLQAQTPGLYVNSFDQSPGAVPQVFVRGTNSITGSNAPLIVVDGLPLASTESINTINTSDIERIDVLRDAAATSIYGSRGANGVIMITTKTNRGGDDLSFQYTGSVLLYEHLNAFDVLDGSEYARFYLDRQARNNGSVALSEFTSQGLPDPLYSFSEGEASSTNWQAETFNQDMGYDHNLAASFATGDLQYRVSLGHLDQAGFLKPRNYQRTILGTSVDYVEERFSFTYRVNSSWEDRQDFSLDMLAAARFVPSVTPLDQEGSLSRHPYFDWWENPLFPLDTRTDESQINNLRMNLDLSFQVSDKSKLHLKMALDQNDQERFFQSTEDWRDGIAINSASLNRLENRNYLGETYYDMSIRNTGKHYLNAVSGISLQVFQFRQQNMFGEGFFAPLEVRDNFNGSASNILTNGRSETRQIASAFSRWHYKYDDWLNVDLTYRLDGASQFLSDNRWGHFPSLGVSARVFENETSFFHRMNLGINYGITGNANVPAGQTTSLIEFDRGFVGSATVARINYWNEYRGNPDLKWEGIATLNASMTLKGPFYWLNVNLYDKRSSNLILNRQLPSESGLRFEPTNVGVVSNRGVEVQWNFWFPLLRKVQTNLDFGFAYNHNRVIDLEDDEILNHNLWIGDWNPGYAGSIQEGFPINAFFGYQYEGVWQLEDSVAAASFGASPGDARFADIASENGEGPDGRITEADRVFLGNADPSYTANVSARWSWQGWTLAIAADGVFDRKILNSNKYLLANPSFDEFSNLSTMALDLWSSDFPQGSLPEFNDRDPRLALSSWTVESADFIRIREVTLGKDINLARSDGPVLRIQFSVGNLYTWTTYSGLNPDRWGIDNQWGVTPFVRTYKTTVNFVF